MTDVLPGVIPWWLQSDWEETAPKEGGGWEEQLRNYRSTTDKRTIGCGSLFPVKSSITDFEREKQGALPTSDTTNCSNTSSHHQSKLFFPFSFYRKSLIFEKWLPGMELKKNNHYS